MFAGISAAKPDPGMIAIAQKIIDQQAGAFDPSKFIDRYEEALKALIAEKKKGHKPVAAAEPEDTNVVDLMEALRASLGGKGKATVRGAPAKKAADRPATKTKVRKAG